MTMLENVKKITEEKTLDPLEMAEALMAGRAEVAGCCTKQTCLLSNNKHGRRLSS
jgi:hypothetical protein